MWLFDPIKVHSSVLRTPKSEKYNLELPQRLGVSVEVWHPTIGFVRDRKHLPMYVKHLWVAAELTRIASQTFPMYADQGRYLTQAVADHLDREVDSTFRAVGWTADAQQEYYKYYVDKFVERFVKGAQRTGRAGTRGSSTVGVSAPERPEACKSSEAYKPTEKLAVPEPSSGASMWHPEDNLGKLFTFSLPRMPKWRGFGFYAWRVRRILPSNDPTWSRGVPLDEYGKGCSPYT